MRWARFYLTITQTQRYTHTQTHTHTPNICTHVMAYLDPELHVIWEDEWPEAEAVGTDGCE